MNNQVLLTDQNVTGPYNKRTWLNPDNSSSTANIIAFDGDVNYSGEVCKTTFLQIADCRKTIKLHVVEYDTIHDFIDKMKLLRNEIDLFINHLEKQYEGNK